MLFGTCPFVFGDLAAKSGLNTIFRNVNVVAMPVPLAVAMLLRWDRQFCVPLEEARLDPLGPCSHACIVKLPVNSIEGFRFP